MSSASRASIPRSSDQLRPSHTAVPKSALDILRIQRR